MLNSQFHTSVKNVQIKRFIVISTLQPQKGDIMYVKYLLVIC